jgi:hypothetical protein
MARVSVRIEEEDDVETEDGYQVEGVRAICTKCEHEVECPGTGRGSILRCCALLREECPLGEKNFYLAKRDE